MSSIIHQVRAGSFCRLIIACAVIGFYWLTPLRAAGPYEAAVFQEALPGRNAKLAEDMAAYAAAAGYHPVFITTETLTNETRLTAEHYRLLILPGACALPGTSGRIIDHFLKTGGNLLAIGLPAWETTLFQIQGRWFSRESYEQLLARQKSEHAIENFRQADLSAWTKSTSDPAPQARYELVETGTEKVLHVTMGHLNGWETFLSPPWTSPFPEGHALTAFRAKGSANTRRLALEWMETDGSRWIATIGLKPEWQDYVLAPDAFKAWPEPPDPKRRPNRFNPAQASRFTVGLAVSHTPLEGDHQEYWFSDLGSARDPLDGAGVPGPADIPTLESVSPTFQCFPITTPVTVCAAEDKAPLERWEEESAASQRSGFTVNSGLVGLHPRPRGVGFNQGRPYRWEPLLSAYDATNADYRGALGALIVHTEPPLRGSVWAVLTPEEPEFYQHPIVKQCLQQVLSRMKRGVFLTEGGGEFFTVFEGQSFKVGARLVNYGPTTATNLTVTVGFDRGHGKGTRVVQRGPFQLAPGETVVVEGSSQRPAGDHRQIAARLEESGRPVDLLRHEVAVWKPKALPEFIEARDGGFWLKGRPWKAHGVNYMPSSGIGPAYEGFFENWLGRGAYDPAVIERDLRRVRSLGLNAVSVFVYREALTAQHLLDFLRRCGALGLHVNQSLRPGTPMEFRWTEMKELIEYFKLAENDAVFAYDLAWEPSHGNQAQQQHDYGALWREWVARRYGSLSVATNAWSFPWPVVGSAPAGTPVSVGTNELAVPAMTLLLRDGSWRRLVADYRSFLDEVLANRYGEARRLVRSIDPHHAVSFRMSCAGDPTYAWDAALPYDFPGLVNAVDLWAPEAYGRIGDWNKVRAGEFTVAYARLCDPTKPLVWAEMGYNVWDMNRMAPEPEKLQFEKTYYEQFYRVLIESGSDGIFFWWYPGGFRRGENSDFGIINPDGTDRPVTRVIRQWGQSFLRAAKPGKPDDWISIDRNGDARGLYGIYEAHQEEFWKAKAQQHEPGLRWLHPVGASSNRP